MPKPLPIDVRFWSKVSRGDGCWMWNGTVSDNGYGKFGIARGVTASYAHRMAYELTVGPIPEGMEIDHLCRTRLCVNPAHLEVVSHTENMRRAFAAKPTCRYGHPYSEKRTAANRRRCLECERRRDREKYAKRKGKGSPGDWYVTTDLATFARLCGD